MYIKFYNASEQVRVANSKMKLHIWYNKLGIRVASRVSEQLKIYEFKKLGNAGNFHI